jgi:5'(3')-deoxyribonucleotidase
MRIGIDCDSTLSNLLDVWLSKYNRDYDDNITPEKILTYEIHRYVRCGEKIYDYLTPRLFRSTRPLPWAVDAVLALHLLGFNPTIITRVWPGTYDAKMKWLSTYFPQCPVVCTEAKELVAVDYWIDDCPDVLSKVPWERAVCFTNEDRYGYTWSWRGARLRSWRSLPVLFLGLKIGPVERLTWPDWDEDTYRTAPPSYLVYRGEGGEGGEG